MKIPCTENLIKLARACPFPLYMVGGYVRDCLAGLECAGKDRDICAPADTDGFIRVAEKCGAEVTAVYKTRARSS